MRDQYLRTPLATAVRLEEENIVKILLARSDILPNAAQDRGQTPLHLAVEQGHIAIMKLLLNTNQVNVDWADMNGDTPLHFAAAEGNWKIVQLLLSNGADANARNRQGQTLLFKAIEAGFGGNGQGLISTGQADPESRASDGRTPFIHAVRMGQFPQNNLKPAQRQRETTILLNSAGLVHSTRHNAPKSPVLDVVEYLLSLDQVDPNARDAQGRTALFWATWRFEVDVVRLLMANERVSVNVWEYDI